MLKKGLGLYFKAFFYFINLKVIFVKLLSSKWLFHVGKITVVMEQCLLGPIVIIYNCNIFIIQANHKIAKNTTTIKAKEKISTSLESLKF
jgi:hypothetical protein